MPVIATHLIGILLAVASAGVLSLGNIWQARGVAQATAAAPESEQGWASAKRLIRTKVWLLGTVMFGLAIVLQMTSLAFAPLMLVQPIGVLALIFAVFLNGRIDGKRPSPAVLKAVGITLVGVTVYVIIAARVSKQEAITDGQLVAVLVTLGAVLVLAAAAKFMGAAAIKRTPVVYVLLGAVFSAFVATLGKTVLLRIQAQFAGHDFTLDKQGLLTLVCVLGIGVASALSIYFVQTAYTCNSSDVVVAGLTVIDPAIAVLLGIVILREATGAPIWSLLAIAAAGLVSMYGVWQLSKAEDAQVATDLPEHTDT